MKRLTQTLFKIIKPIFILPTRNVSYTQGQEPQPKVREYFYYIDHEGMLFLDDSRMKNFTTCFKDKKFLHFFFTRLKINETNRYQEEFPFVSVCGRERNFIRCDDLPIVYTHLLVETNGEEKLSYGNAGEFLTAKFEPDKIYMSPSSGRVYHPTDVKFGSIGLIRSKLAIEFSKHFRFDNGEDNPPTNFTWNKVDHILDKDWVKNVVYKKIL